MADNRIARTRTQDLQPLGTAGQFASDSWGTLSALLTRELSASHAALLAEPVPDPSRGETDWYTHLEGVAVSLDGLLPEAQAAARARLQALTSDVHALGTRLLAARTDSERFNGEMLMLCLQMPEEGRIMVVGDQPVLIGWGHSRAGDTAVPAMVTGRRASPSNAGMAILPPPKPPAPPGRNRLLFLGGAAGGLLIAAICAMILLTFDPFGWSAIPIAQCAIPPDQHALAATLQDAVARGSALQLERARLETDAGTRRLQCAPIVPAVVLPAAPPPTRDEAQAARQGAKTGKLQIILAWDDQNDLDLHVLCPGGGAIDFGHREVCGGMLDIDANGDANHLTDTAVENVYFTDPPEGHYRIVVDPYGMRVRASTPFRVTIRQEGRPTQEIAGTAVSGRRSQIVAEIDVAHP
jgi:hypothetical protein